MATNDVWGARADQVGSLLRSDRLIAARDKANTGQMDAGELRAMEDDAIRDVVRMPSGGSLRLPRGKSGPRDESRELIDVAQMAAWE